VQIELDVFVILQKKSGLTWVGLGKIIVGHIRQDVTVRLGSVELKENKSLNKICSYDDKDL